MKAKEEIKIEVAEEIENLEELETILETKIRKKIGLKLPWFVAYPIIVIIALVIIYVIFRICNPDFNIKKSILTFKEESITNISISVSKPEIEVGKSVKLDIKIEPSNFNLNNITWVSSNPEAIWVENGVITGILTGKANIYAKAGDIVSNEIEFSCIVNVTEIVLSKDKINLSIGESETITAHVIPEEASNKTIMWESADTKIATVENGKITGVSLGNTMITASDSTGGVVATCIINVKPIEVIGVSLDETNVTLGKGQEYLLVGNIEPSNATYKKVLWSSSDTNVVNVDNGKVTAVRNRKCGSKNYIRKWQTCNL